MHRPLRTVLALLIAASVALVPSLALGQDDPPDRRVASGVEDADHASEAGDESSDAAPGAARGDASPEALASDAPAEAGGGADDVAADPVIDAAGSDQATDVRPDHLAIRLACAPASRGDERGIACKWSEASAPAAGYRLWRAVDVPNPASHREVIARGGLDFRSHVDTEVAGGHTYHYAVEVVTANGRTLGWSPMVQVDLVRDEQLRLSCEGHDADRITGVVCVWSRSQHPRFAGYRLVRSDGDRRTTVFESREVEVTRFLDEEVRRGVRYTYLVQVVDRSGHVIGESGTSTAGLPPIPDERLRIDCELATAGDARGVTCKWEEASHPEAAGYVLYRSVDGGPRTAIHRAGLDGPTRHLDTEVRPGHRYRYAVVLVDAEGATIGGGGPVEVAIPSTSDRPPATDRPVVEPGR